MMQFVASFTSPVRRSRIALFLVIAVTSLLIFTFSVTSVALVGDGWVPYPLASSEFQPYVDFFFPVPPLEVYFGRLISLSTQPVLVYHLFSILWGLIAVSSVFVLLRMRHSIFNSFVFSLFFMSIWLSDRFDRFGGWNQKYVSFLIAALAFFAAGIESSGNRRKRQFLLAGIFIGLSLATKQSALLPAAFLLLGGLVVEYSKRQPLTHWGFLVSGIMAPISAIILHAQWNSYLRPMISDLAELGGKEATVLQQAKFIIGDFQSSIMSTGAAMLLLGVYAAHKVRDEDRVLFKTLVTALALTLFSSIFPGSNHVVILPLTAILIASGIAPASNKIFRLFVLLVTISAFVLMFIWWVFVEGPNQLERLVGLNPLSEALVGVTVLSSILISVIYVGQNLAHGVLRMPLLAGILHVDGRLFLIACFTIGFAVTQILSGPLHIWPIAAGFVLIIASFEISLTGALGDLLKSLRLLIVVTLALGFLGRGLQYPADWWGWRSSPLKPPRYQVDHKYLKGFWMGPAEAIYFRTLISTFENIGTANNEVLKIVTYPHVPFAVNLSGFQPIHMDCAVVFFDLCPDALAKSSLKQMINQSPDVVVWAKPSDLAFQVNETFYRGGGVSSLRLWEYWRMHVLNSGAYRRVLSISMPGQQPTTGWTTEVLVKQRIALSLIRQGYERGRSFS